MVDKVPPSFSSMELMRHVSRFILVAAGGSVLLLTGCETARVAGGGPYHVTAYRPHDPSAVRVRVSLSKQNVYVMEGDRCLMAAAISVGIPGKPTPKGNFTITQNRNRNAPVRMGLACRAIALSLRPGAGPDAMSVIRWDIGVNSRQHMGFTKALCIRTRVRMDVSGCMAKLRQSFTRW